MSDPISGDRPRAGGPAESDDEGGVRRGAVRGALVVAVGAAFLAGSGPAVAWAGEPPDPAVMAPAAGDPAPEGRPEAGEPAVEGAPAEDGVPAVEGRPEAGAPAVEGVPLPVGAAAGPGAEAVAEAGAEAASGPEEGLAGAEEEGGGGVSAARRLEAAVAYAVAHIGDPYALGGRGPHRWDCSGLVQEAYRRAGVRLPRVAADQYRATARVPRRSLRRGDLVFWSSDGRASGVHHVAIYLGGERYVEAARPGTKVRISTFSRNRPRLYGRVRLPAGRALRAAAADGGVRPD
ncbi:C40 family peptidase [Streptomyces caatingaensis]|uniref:C40 family peptidase n=1 Tax=Streptomyces caatingaensis TaxID=1678637 RepID=UPI000B173CDE|nr:C40 family peptidase [Streptomyces caatingaensis]